MHGNTCCISILIDIALLDWLKMTGGNFPFDFIPFREQPGTNLFYILGIDSADTLCELGVAVAHTAVCC